MKTLVAVAAALAVMATTGCCWPMHEGGHRRYQSAWDDGTRAAPARPADGAVRGDGRRQLATPGR